MTPPDDLADIRLYIVVTTIGPSTLRNQGDRGIISATQRFLASLPLDQLEVTSETDFQRALDRLTNQLASGRPRVPWGAARKALNLFIRDVGSNRFVSERHKLGQIEPWMELPLDGLVGRRLRREGKARKHPLPAWPGLKSLTPGMNAQYQALAGEIAAARGISRARLDIRLWLEERGSSVEHFIKDD